MSAPNEDNTKRIHAQRKFAQGSAVLPKENVVELPVQSPVRKDSEPAIQLCKKRAEELLTELCFREWNMGAETSPNKPIKTPIVVLSDCMKKKSSCRIPKTSSVKPIPGNKPCAVKESASKSPLVVPNACRGTSSNNVQRDLIPSEKSTIITDRRESLRSSLRKNPQKLSDNLSLRTRSILKTDTIGDKVTKPAHSAPFKRNIDNVIDETGSKAIQCRSANKKSKANTESEAISEKTFNESDEEPLAEKVKEVQKSRIGLRVSTKRAKSDNKNPQTEKEKEKKNTRLVNNKKKNTNFNDVYEFRDDVESLSTSTPIANDFNLVELSPHQEIVSAISTNPIIQPVADKHNCEKPDRNVTLSDAQTVSSTVNNEQIMDIPADSKNEHMEVESLIKIVERDLSAHTHLMEVGQSSSTDLEVVQPIPDPQQCQPTLDSINTSENKVKNEDGDIIFVKKLNKPCFPLQKQLEKIIKEVNVLKKSVALSSNHQAVRSIIKTRGKAKVLAAVFPKIPPINKTEFPKCNDLAEIVDAPVFKPTEEEFQDPFEYIEKITPFASQFGIARVIPPANFQPACQVSDDMRFISDKQYIHRMFSRWGPSTRDMVAITSHLKSQQFSLDPPTIGGLELDVPLFYHVVEKMGGVKEVVEKQSWPEVAAKMNIPVPTTKLEEIYFKYILPFVTLSNEERQENFKKANQMWVATKAHKKSRAHLSSLPHGADLPETHDINNLNIDVEELECITKGKSMSMSDFNRLSKNAMNMWFPTSTSNSTSGPTPEVVEKEFWSIADKAKKHVVVHSASVNTGNLGCGFPSSKTNIPSAKHPWNLKVMCSSPGSVLRSMGNLIGVSIPTLHLGMVFSTSCWYRDPHGLPWIEYLHTGSPKIWYGLPETEGERFRAGFKNLAPFVCKDKKIWLPSETTMIPPESLRDTGVSLCRTVQHPGEYIIVFPKAYSSSICTGNSVSESVYLSPFSWLETAFHDFEDLQSSCEPSLFSIEHLLISIAEDPRSTTRLLIFSHTLLSIIFEREKENRGILRSYNIPLDERPARCEEGAVFPALERARQGDDNEECEVCKQRCHLSYVYDLKEDDQIYCLVHAIELISEETVTDYSNAMVYCKYSSAQLSSIIKRLQDRLTIDIRESSSSNIDLITF